jgi:hypothetical protein
MRLCIKDMSEDLVANLCWKLEQQARGLSMNVHMLEALAEMDPIFGIRTSTCY